LLTGECACRLVAVTLHHLVAATSQGREFVMGKAPNTQATKTPLEQSIDEALLELEKLTDEIRVKLHLASMDANVAWNEKLEPRLFEARGHASEAKAASKHAIDDAVKAFKAFAASL
jgi:hypothetical protein